ncbi:MAG: carboxypeptidase regulatory-like domain-containing protein [Bacteroidales bacterium]
MMRNKGWTFVVLCLLALLWAMPASAQEQTGSIEGIVKDASGGVLPGVTVTVTSPGLVGTSTAVTDSEGRYRFPALPPSTYTVTATLQGFNTWKVTTRLSLGQVIKVDISLVVGGVTETVQVTGEAPLIDTKQNAAFATVSKDMIDRIPKGRDFTDVITVAPGANAEAKSGGIQVDGASGSENRFVVDGMDTTNLQNGVSGKTMLVDFIQEVQVKSSGYNAEYGGATGGVISAITKSGSNQMRGSIGLYEENTHFRGSLDNRGGVGYSSWNGTNGIANPIGCGSATTPGGLTCTANPNRVYGKDTPWQYFSPIGDIGGPIFKDKLWYYFGLAYTTNDYNWTGKFLNEPGHPDRTFDWYSHTTYPNYNVTTQLGSSMRLRVSGSNQRQHYRGTGPGFANVNQVMDADPNRYKPTSCTNLALQDMFGKTLDGYTTNSTTSWLSSLSTGCTFNQTAFDNIYKRTGGDNRQDVLSGNLDWVLKPTFFINTTAGFFRTNTWNDPTWSNDALQHVFGNGNQPSNMNDPQYPNPNDPNGVWPAIPVQYQQPNGYTDQSQNSRLLKQNIYTRYFVNANAILYKSLAGQHVFKGGVRFERFGENIYDGRTQPVINFYWGRTYNATDGRTLAGKYGYYMVNKTGSIGQVWSNNWSFWLQDSWTIKNNLTINAGVRTENENVPNFKKDVPVCGDTIDATCAMQIKFGFSEKIAPRIGFAYDFKGDSKWKAYGSFGLFYDITKLELPRGSFGGEHWINYYWSLDTYDWQGITCGEGPTGCPGTFYEPWDARRSSNQLDPDLSAYFGKPMTGVDPGLMPLRTGEYTLGLSHELNPTMSISARYVHKWLTRTIEDVGLLLPGIGEIYIIGNPGFGTTEVMNPSWPQFTTPKATRDYDGIEFRLTKRLANRWSAEVDYTYSKLWGNYSGLASSDESGRTSPNVNRYFDNLYMSYNDRQQAVFGNLPTDRPHVFKVQATYDFTFGTSVGAFFILQSGLPMTSQVSFAGYPVYYDNRGDLGRLPTYKQIDLNVQHDIKVGGNRRITLQANIFNVFDFATYTNMYTTSVYRQNMTPPNTDQYFFGAPWTPSQLATQMRAAGNTVLDSDFYRTLNGQQGRRTLRFMAKFSF